MPFDGNHSFDYRQWLKEQRLDDFHFGDHLRAAADARSSGRSITLNELHQISARREARRWSARVSGGVTGLLLVCGIAGTLWCIKPVLGAFKVTESADGSVGAPASLSLAQNLIHDLSSAFWPSLVALILTVVVAFARGLYTHNKGILAGELDQLDLEDLFQRFPPPSLAWELNAIREQLANLTAQMLASQANFDGFVQKLSAAAEGFRSDAPLLQAASKQFVDGVRELSPKLDELGTTITNHLGPQAPVVQRFDGLLGVANGVNKTAGQMKVMGTLLSQHVSESHQLLKATTDALPTQIQTACQSASTIIADAASRALADACADAVARLDSAAEPLRQASQSIVEDNQELKAATTNSITQLTQSVRDLCEATAAAVSTDVRTGVDTVTHHVDSLLMRTANQVRDQLDQAQQRFSDALGASLTIITSIKGDFDATLTRMVEFLDQLDQVQSRIEIALRDSEHSRDVIGHARSDIVDATHQMSSVRDVLDNTSKILVDMQKDLSANKRMLGKLTNDLGVLHPELEKLVSVQGDLGVRIEALMARAEQVGAQWQRWLPEATQLNATGASLKENLDRLLKQAGTVADGLAKTTAAAGEQQQRLAEELAILAPALDSVAELYRSSRFGRFFRPKS
jgi:hypothetical protein